MVSYTEKQVKLKFALIIDFDSTIISHESLECIAEFALFKNKNKKNIIKKINKLTNLAMNGNISFQDSLDKRLSLMNISDKNILDTIEYLKNKIDLSFIENINFFKDHINDIYIVSGGFESIIKPLMQHINDLDWKVYANKFIKDKNNNVKGINKNNILYRGKVEAVNSLKLNKEIIVVGDGYTDYELKKNGLAKYFLAYTKYIKRDKVIRKSDLNCNSFNDVIKFIKRNY